MTRLKVYDGSGRLVRTLANEEVEAGVHPLSWDGKDNAGYHLSTGAYLFNLSSGPFHRAQKASLTR